MYLIRIIHIIYVQKNKQQRREGKKKQQQQNVKGEMGYNPQSYFPNQQKTKKKHRTMFHVEIHEFRIYPEMLLFDFVRRIALLYALTYMMYTIYNTTL